MTNRGIDIQHPKLRGEWAELRFMARAAEHGLRVSKPFGDCADYDATVEHGGIFHHVQIKSTKSHQRRSHSYACGIRRTSGKPYTKDQVDFFAVYITPCDVWYIFKPLLRPALAALGENGLEVAFVGRGRNQKQHQKRRTGVSALHQRKIAALEALKKSLLHQAFTGQL
jgi:hypothetical protein